MQRGDVEMERRKVHTVNHFFRNNFKLNLAHLKAYD